MTKIFNLKFSYVYIRSKDTHFEVHLNPKYFFRLNKSLHLFEMHFNLDFLIGYKSYEVLPSSVLQPSQ